MELGLSCRCGSQIAFSEVNEDWAIAMASMFASAHATTCGFVERTPQDAEALDTDD